MAARRDVTALIAEHLHSMPHPDGRPRRFMHHSQFAGGNNDPKVQAAVCQIAADHAVSIQHLLETSGYSITHRDDPRAADAESYKTAQLNCSCGKQLLQLGVDTNMVATLSAAARQSAIAALATECPRHE